MNKMTSTNQVNTLALLNTSADYVHLILHNAFRLLKPVRRKYRLSVNALLILNAVYLYHKYKGSVISANGIYKTIRYYNRDKIKYYIGILKDKGIIMQAEHNAGADYYKITELGLTVMREFCEGYSAIMAKFLIDQKIDI